MSDSEDIQIEARAGTAPVDRRAFREAMARIAAAVHVVTTAGPAGRAGLTATAVCPVSDHPPTMLVCINRTGRLNAVFKTNDAFCVNTLGSGQQALADAFAGRGALSMPARFAIGRWSELKTGAPALDGALASIDCTIDRIEEAGTHSILIGRIVGLRTGAAGPALVYLDRGYRTL